MITTFFACQSDFLIALATFPISITNIRTEDTEIPYPNTVLRVITR